MKFILLVFVVAVALYACDDKEPTETHLGIGAKGVGVSLGNNLCVDPATAQVMVCVEL